MSGWTIVWHVLLVGVGILAFALVFTGIVTALFEFVIDPWVDRREAAAKAQERARREIARVQADAARSVQRIGQAYLTASDRLRDEARRDRS